MAGILFDPHDPPTRWSYCVTMPPGLFYTKSRDLGPVVVGIQSPEGITTTQGVLRRFNHYLKLKKAFPNKKIVLAPPKGLLSMKSRTLLEERRCYLEEWVTKLLSDIDLSRSVTLASFLELKAALSSESVRSNTSSLRGNEMSHCSIPNSCADGSPDLHRCAEVSSTREILGNTDLHFPGDAELVFPLYQRQKLSRVLLTMERRLVAAKTDMEDLITRLNEEIAVKDYLITKVSKQYTFLEISGFVD